ncbi:serine hydrolase domain-containing protein [Caulobacter sp. 17J65-9]|uniref:serine hydrolase domain-containing protein n=1 Tax=Caulobacter sp. 17J65-9 TaxID=2709382 RepID=UPI0013C65AD6|nr:serine hydrolase domain-containing protein [Caulobacter sp. 17J65-9]NEX95209.1 beta-lactamase family protein [Caulobacter sp. 17J65-9]
MIITRRFALTGLGLSALAVALPANAEDPAAAAEQALDALAAEGRLSGAALAAVGGRPVLRKAWGLADRERQIANRPDTRFNLASAGKLFTTVAIGQLLQEGRLSLDDRLSDHLPAFPAAVASRITLGQLLTHTSGLGSYFGSPGWAQVRASIRSVADYVDLVREEQPQFEPGARYAYSNSGFALLGAVIERLDRRDYYESVRRRVFRPAGMTRTGYPALGETAADLAIGYTNGCFAQPNCTPGEWTDARSQWPGRGGPAGGGASTVDDLFRFAVALTDGRLLKPATLAGLKAERGRMDRPGGPIDAYASGFGRLTVNGRPSFGHNGGTIGAAAQLDVFEDAPLVLVVLVNQDGAQRPASARLRKAFAG